MEIERKWLADKEHIPYDLQFAEKNDIEQVYISTSPTIRARKINGGEQYILTVKTKPVYGNRLLARNEYEMPISAEEYAELYKRRQGIAISKTRFSVRGTDGLVREIDFFHEELTGLVFVEIEFPDEESAVNFPSPDWVKRDVTYEKEYKNGYLALNGMPDTERR